MHLINMERNRMQKNAFVRTIFYNVQPVCVMCECVHHEEIIELIVVESELSILNFWILKRIENELPRYFHHPHSLTIDLLKQNIK